MSLADILTGPKLFKRAFGQRWGLHVWRIFFVGFLGAVVVSGAMLAYRWLYPPATAAQCDNYGNSFRDVQIINSHGPGMAVGSFCNNKVKGLTIKGSNGPGLEVVPRPK